jgi:peptidoglycan/LPS O-acetylase OafA/YrhL
MSRLPRSKKRQIKPAFIRSIALVWVLSLIILCFIVKGSSNAVFYIGLYTCCGILALVLLYAFYKEESKKRV